MTPKHVWVILRRCNYLYSLKGTGVWESCGVRATRSSARLHMRCLQNAWGVNKEDDWKIQKYIIPEAIIFGSVV